MGESLESYLLIKNEETRILWLIPFTHHMMFVLYSNTLHSEPQMLEFHFRLLVKPESLEAVLLVLYFIVVVPTPNFQPLWLLSKYHLWYTEGCWQSNSG